MELSGKFIGFLTYNSKNKNYNGKKLHFEMQLTQSGTLINGTSKDTSGVGIHPEAANIEGTIIGRNLNFVKQYPTSHHSGKNGEVIINEKLPGHLIDYSGNVDSNNSTISGSWKMRVKVYLFGLIPMKFTQVGTWEMAPE